MKNRIIKTLSLALAASAVFGVFGVSAPVAAATDETTDETEVTAEADADVEADAEADGLVKNKGIKETIEYGTGFGTEAIIGSDDRKVIKDTTKYPYSAIAHIYMQYSCGHAGYGTGFMISDNTMLTAGHCVICTQCRQKLSAINCKFGYDYNDESYIVQTNGCKTFYYSSAYLAGTKSDSIEGEDYDYAYVVFSQPIGSITGHFGIKAFSDSALKGKDFKVGGYRLDKEPLRMATGKVTPGYTYKNSNGKTTKVNDKYLLSYKADTIAGNSGGPVFDKDYYVAGIHVAGVTGQFNLARRITQGTMDDLKKYDLIDNSKSVKPVKNASLQSVNDGETISCQVVNKARMSIQIPYTNFADIKWSSSDKAIATVNSVGVVTAKKIGDVVITGKHGSETVKCKVKVIYSDVKDAKKFWYTPTYYLSSKDVVKGYDNQTKFKPANDCTRAQMVTFLWRLKGSPAPKTKTCKFKDVKTSDYFYKAVLWGNEKGIVEGYKNGTFGPQIVCARKHAVTFLWRLAGKPTPKTKTNKFKDVKAKDYFYKAVLWASEKKIVAGYKDGTFKPNGNCLRRQMVTFLYKFDQAMNPGKKATPTATPKATPKPTTAPSGANTSEKEPNDTYKTATVLTLGKGCKGEIGDYDKYLVNRTLDEDWYSVKLTAGKTYRFKMAGYMDRYEATTLLVSGYVPGDDVANLKYSLFVNSGMSREQKDYFDFTAEKSGTYYFRLWNFFNYTAGLTNTNYTVSVSEI